MEAGWDRDRGRVTSALDLALALIEEDRGPDTARRVARELVTYLQRPRNQAQVSMFVGAAIEVPLADDVTVDYQPQELTELNLEREGISTIIWATGYGLDYSWIDVPLLDELGYPRNAPRVAAIPGLFFLGLLWRHSQASASLVGPGLDGPYPLEMMNRQARRRPVPAR